MNTTDAQVFRKMFTDAQWDAISSAMKDFADHGEEEATIADEIESKIFSIFRDTEWYKSTLIVHQFTNTSLQTFSDHA